MLPRRWLLAALATVPLPSDRRSADCLPKDKPQIDGELSNRAGWAVYQSSHGCVHLRLGNLTLTFSAAELHDLVRLLCDAYVRLSVREAVKAFGTH